MKIFIFFRKKVVYDVFDFYADMLRNTPALIRWLIGKVDLWAMGIVDAVILTDDARREQIRGASPKRIEVVNNSPEPLVLRNSVGDKKISCGSST